MKVTCGIVKRAWIRTPGHPAGKPAPGRINCPCGQTPESMFNPTNGRVVCPCGITYTWNGWIIKDEREAATPTITD